MTDFHEMLRKVTSSRHHDRMQKFASPLKDYFGINHFWYYRITNSGHYCFLGTHTAWNEFCFDNALCSYFPCLRHPNILQDGIHLMKAAAESKYLEILETAWGKFQINMSINLIQNIPEGIEAFGFATCFNDIKAEERLLNELPLLRLFTKAFRSKHKKLFSLLEDNQVDLSHEFGAAFYQPSASLTLPCKRKKFLREIGFNDLSNLTPRETDILKFISYPASFIAQQLHLSVRTVENNLAIIKEKLSCDSKIDLIKRAQEIEAAGYFEM